MPVYSDRLQAREWRIEEALADVVRLYRGGTSAALAADALACDHESLELHEALDRAEANYEELFDADVRPYLEAVRAALEEMEGPR
jgi:hypothetical protein